MCSIGEDDFGDEGGAHTMLSDPKLPASVIVSNEMCKQCNERNVTVKLNLKDAQCEPCFFKFVRHKIRATIGATRIIERGAKVLLAFDGTIESCVMFDMIKHALSQDQFKRFTIQPYAVYIDDSCISGQSITERQQQLSETLTILQHFGFESYYLSIANAVPIIKLQSFQLDNEQLKTEEKFVMNFNRIGNQTAKEDYLIITKLNLYREVAAQINCKYIFVPSISHQVATDLLVSVALGRAKSVANDIGFCDNRSNCAAKIIRPMRNINSLEIETYIRLDVTLNQLTKRNKIFNIENSNQITCIQSLTKQFIDNLQENFASTVSTVFRTGDKISAAAATTTTTTNEHADNESTKPICKFCHSDLDYQQSATLFAIEYSRCASACADQNQINNIDLMLKKANDNLVLGNNDDDDTANLIQSLCHGCRNIFRDLDEPSAYVH